MHGEWLDIAEITANYKCRKGNFFKKKARKRSPRKVLSEENFDLKRLDWRATICGCESRPV
jgi:hypothetical protein